MQAGSPVSINNLQILPDSFGEYSYPPKLLQSSLYDTTLTFNFIPPDNNNISVTGSLYSPKAIHITNIAKLSALTVKRDSSVLITWNADPKNQKGVILSLQGHYVNSGVSILVPDNGSYILPWSFFEKLGLTSSTILWAERGSYVILQSGQNKYKVGGYSTTAIWEVNIIP